MVTAQACHCERTSACPGGLSRAKQSPVKRVNLIEKHPPFSRGLLRRWGTLLARVPAHGAGNDIIADVGEQLPSMT